MTAPSKRQVNIVHTDAGNALEGALATAQTNTPHVWNTRLGFGANMQFVCFVPLPLLR
jgi:hypothetical protein